MLFSNVFSFLLSFASLAVALPGGATPDYDTTPPNYTPTPPKYTPPPPPPVSSNETICSSVIATKTSIGEKPTTYVTTKTIVIPVTTFTEKPKTVTTGYPFTSTGYNTKTVTDLETELATKTYSTVSVITTTIYNTKVETATKTNTKLETLPFTSIGTKYSTSVGNVKETYVATITTGSVCTETAKVPFTSTSVETKTACTTKGGYGGGW